MSYKAMSTRSATATGMTWDRDRVVVLDFGGQYSHLIVRRCRDLGVYTELLPSDVPIEELKKQQAVRVRSEALYSLAVPLAFTSLIARDAVPKYLS